MLDVLIIGGGPAGSAAAIMLAHAGLRTAVLERSGYDGLRVGETLPPSAIPFLHRLGVWDGFVSAEHLPSAGIVSVWGNERPYENDFIYNPYGSGWHIDRCRFDAMLAEAAEGNGAAIVRQACVRTCKRTNRGGWRISAECDGRDLQWEADWLIDASGRAAWLAQRQGASRRSLDQLVGVVGILRESISGDSRTFLESSIDGWWYSALLPGRQVVAIYMTDADLLPRGPEELRAFWRMRLMEAPYMAAVCGFAGSVELRTVSANTSILDHLSGPNWLAIGDASATYDPLSSQGICRALQSGCYGAQAVCRAISGSLQTLKDYSRWLKGEFEKYLIHYQRFYAQVTKWPESRFWQRRGSVPIFEKGQRWVSVDTQGSA